MTMLEDWSCTSIIVVFLEMVCPIQILFWQLLKMSVQLILTNSSILILGKLSPHFLQEDPTPCLPSGESPASGKSSTPKRHLLGSDYVKSDRTIYLSLSTLPYKAKYNPAMLSVHPVQ